MYDDFILSFSGKCFRFFFSQHITEVTGFINDFVSKPSWRIVASIVVMRNEVSLVTIVWRLNQKCDRRQYLRRFYFKLQRQTLMLLLSSHNQDASTRYFSFCRGFPCMLDRWVSGRLLCIDIHFHQHSVRNKRRSKFINNLFFNCMRETYGQFV